MLETTEGSCSKGQAKHPKEHVVMSLASRLKASFTAKLILIFMFVCLITLEPLKKMEGL